MLPILRDNSFGFYNLRLCPKSAHPCKEQIANFNFRCDKEMIVTIWAILRAKANTKLINYWIDKTVLKPHFHFDLLAVVHGECAPEIGSNVRDSVNTPHTFFF